MKRHVSPIRDVLKNVFTQLEDKKKYSKEVIESCWRELVGDRGFGHSRPVSLRKGVLTVRVDSSGWMQEFSIQKRKLLKGLKRELGKDRISELHFRIGEF